MAFALRPTASFDSIQSRHGSQALAEALRSALVDAAPKSGVTAMAGFESGAGSEVTSAASRRMAGFASAVAACPRHPGSRTPMPAFFR